MNYKELSKCRVCDGSLEIVLDLGSIYQSNFTNENSTNIKSPLTLTRCTKCNLVQLLHELDLDTMYRQYWYKSSLNPSMLIALQDIVTNTLNQVTLQKKDIIVDIGCNDTAMLRMYPADTIKIGFDPALNLAEEAKKYCDYFINNYFDSKAYPVKEKAKIVTTIAMLYDLPNPNEFIKQIKQILHEDGVWVIQFTDLLSMLKINAIDSVCHEHIEIYSLSVLKKLLNNQGLDIFDISYNTVNGGSLRAYVCHIDKRKILPSVNIQLKKEAEYITPNSFKDFSVRIEKIKRDTVKYIKDCIEAGNTIYVLGASTKGNTLLQYYGLDNTQLQYAVEVNSEKFGLRTVGTNIPIISEETALSDPPNYFLVLPWHFKDMFIKKFDGYLQSGGKLIFPLPEPTVITKNKSFSICQ